MKNTFLKVLSAAIGLFAVTSPVFAALPTSATDAITSVSTAVGDAVDAVWPVIGVALVAVVTIKLVKRFVNKV